MYKKEIYTKIDGTKVDVGIILTDNNIKYHIPLDPKNKDYQAYLEWVAEGNTPEPADE